MKSLNLTTIAFVSSLILLLNSCGAFSNKPSATFVLTEVNGSKENVANMAFVDDNIAINWSYDSKDRFDFRLKNKTDRLIKILWDNGAYIGNTGRSNRIIHKGVKFIKKDEAQHPTSVHPQSFIDDLIIPSNIIRYSDVLEMWITGTLVGGSKEELNSYYGQTVKVVLPIEVDDIIIDYTFTFEIRKLS